MKEILIKYPINFLQQELINIRTNFRLEKKKIIEILRNMKSIKKLSKEDLIELLIKYNYDISKLPKLETLIRSKKEEPKKKESKKKEEHKKIEEPKKEEEHKKIEEPKKEEPKFIIKKNPSTDDYMRMKEDFKYNKYEWTKQAYKEGLNDNKILEYSGLEKNDYKLLNAFFTPKKIIDDMIEFSYIYDNLLQAERDNKIINILECSGGIGNIIYYILENIYEYNKYLLDYIKIDFIEINNTFIEIARAKLEKYNNIINYYNIDFFEFKTNKKYDFIFGNPPYRFTKNRKNYYDVDFFNKCWDLLDFKIIFLMSPSSLTLKTQSHKLFLDNIADYRDDNNIHKYKDAFKKAETPAGITKIDTLLFVLEKN